MSTLASAKKGRCGLMRIFVGIVAVVMFTASHAFCIEDVTIWHRGQKRPDSSEWALCADCGKARTFKGEATFLAKDGDVDADEPFVNVKWTVKLTGGSGRLRFDRDGDDVKEYYDTEFTTKPAKQGRVVFDVVPPKDQESYNPAENTLKVTVTNCDNSTDYGSDEDDVEFIEVIFTDPDDGHEIDEVDVLDGETALVPCDVTPDGAGQHLTFVSDDNSIARAFLQGGDLHVKGQKLGNTSIKAETWGTRETCNSLSIHVQDAIVKVSLSSKTPSDTRTVILNNTPNPETDTYFDGQFEAVKEGFNSWSGAAGWCEVGANTKSRNMQLFVHGFQPKIKNSGDNMVSVWFKGIETSSPFTSTSTKNVDDDYRFKTAKQVQHRGPENKKGMYWQDAKWRECDVNNTGEEKLYPLEGNREVEFTVEVQTYTASAIAVQGFAIGTTITVAGSVGIITTPAATALGITVGGIYTVAGIVASDNVDVVDERLDIQPKSVGDGEYARVKFGTVGDLYWRNIDAYPDADQNGIADGPLVENKTTKYYKNVRHRVEVKVIHLDNNGDVK